WPPAICRSRRAMSPVLPSRSLPGRRPQAVREPAESRLGAEIGVEEQRPVRPVPESRYPAVAVGDAPERDAAPEPWRHGRLVGTGDLGVAARLARGDFRRELLVAARLVHGDVELRYAHLEVARHHLG